MQFLTKNGFRTAVIVFVLFLAVPFLFVDRSSKALQSAQGEGSALPVGISKNPLSKFFNRVAGFYGFKKKQNSLDNLNSFANAGDAAKNLGFNDDGYPITFDGSSEEAQKGFIAMQQQGGQESGGGADIASSNVQEYVRMEGKTYEVVKDPSGKKYVMTDNGPVSFDEIMSSTISKEDFETAKKIAPSLSDEELGYAIRSPYGVQGYLDRKAKGLLTYDDNPSLFGGPDGNLQGQRGTDLFGGPSGHSMFGNSDQAFDEAKSGLAGKYAKVRRDAAAAAAPRSIASSYSAGGQVNGKYKEPMVAEIASLIVGKPVIGNAEAAGIVEKKKEKEKNKSASFEEVEAGKVAQKEVSGDVSLKREDKGIIAESKDARNLMTQELRAGKTFKGKYTDCTVNCEEENPWLFPNKVDLAPGKVFFDNNPILWQTEGNRISWDNSDVVYDNTKPLITENKPKIGKLSYLMIDGKDENGTIKLVKPEAYHYQVFKGLIGNADDIAQGGSIDPKKIDPKRTIFVVPDAQTAANLKKAGLNAVEFEKYAVTPTRLTNFYNDTLKVVQNMADNKNVTTDKKQAEITKQAIAELSGKVKKKS